MSHDDDTALRPPGDGGDEGPLTPQAAAAQRAVRALPAPAADPAYRARLKDAFVAGTPVGAARPVAAADPGARPVAARRPGRLRPALMAAFAAAVVAVAFVGVLAFNPGPRWHVSPDQQADGNVVLDGDPVPAGDRASLDALLLAGSSLEWQGHGDLELVSAGGMVLQVVPGTRMTLPAPPPRWLWRTMESRVEEGEIRVTTGPAFRGARFVITTPETRVEVTGTTFAVICEPMGTCVCVLEGEVGVMLPQEQRMAMVPAGMRQVVFADGSPPEQADIRPMEGVKLGMMKDAKRPLLEGRQATSP